MNILREIQRWNKRGQRSLRRLWPNRANLELPSWQPVESPYGPGIALTFQGQELWLCSPDATLDPTPEAALCLLAPWCAKAGVSLHISQAHLSPVFLANVTSATAVMGRWWKHQAIRFPTPTPLQLPAPTATINIGPKALFFSGGVDSFYSLIMNTDVRVIVFVVGFDARLANRAAWEVMLRSHREVATARGIRLITVFTNLREHPVLRKLSWEHYHGAALAAVAHSLRSQSSNWIISASSWPENLDPWGSHPDLDWRWGSESMTFTHFGIDKWRGEKLAAMAEDEFAFLHLKVCYKTITAGNCGTCEKCVRTRLAHHCEVPERPCEYMPESPTLLKSVDGLKLINPHDHGNNYERSRSLLPGGDPLVAAIDRLLERSRPKPWWIRLRSYVLQHL